MNVCPATTKTYGAFKILQESMSLSYNPQVFLLTNIPSTRDHFIIELFLKAKKDKDFQVFDFRHPKRH